jgi:DNA-binding NarL/FixJ family response regulator
MSAGQRNVGEKNGQAKLTAREVREIRHSYRVGWPVAEIARTHGVSESTVWHVVKRRTWGHVK